MKNLRSLRRAILIVTATTLFATACSKDNTVISEKPAKVNVIYNSVKTIDPNVHQYGAVKGYVLPPEAMAIVSIANTSDGSYFSVATDNNGLFAFEKVPTGVYTLEVVPTNSFYRSVQMDVIVSADQTTSLTITLAKG